MLFRYINDHSAWDYLLDFLNFKCDEVKVFEGVSSVDIGYVKELVSEMEHACFVAKDILEDQKYRTDVIELTDEKVR